MVPLYIESTASDRRRWLHLLSKQHRKAFGPCLEVNLSCLSGGLRGHRAVEACAVSLHARRARASSSATTTRRSGFASPAKRSSGDACSPSCADSTGASSSPFIPSPRSARKSHTRAPPPPTQPPSAPEYHVFATAGRNVLPSARKRSRQLHPLRSQLRRRPASTARTSDGTPAPKWSALPSPPELGSCCSGGRPRARGPGRCVWVPA